MRRGIIALQMQVPNGNRNYFETECGFCVPFESCLKHTHMYIHSCRLDVVFVAIRLTVIDSMAAINHGFISNSN